MDFAPAHGDLGWKVAPRYIIRDRDAVYGDVFIRRLRAMSIRDRPTAPRSPWQNGYCERAIGSIRRECLDHVVVFGERHLRHLLLSYATYYNGARTPSNGPGRFFAAQFSAGCTTNMSGFDLRQAQSVKTYFSPCFSPYLSPRP